VEEGHHPVIVGLGQADHFALRHVETGEAVEQQARRGVVEEGEAVGRGGLGHLGQRLGSEDFAHLVVEQGAGEALEDRRGG